MRCLGPCRRVTPVPRLLSFSLASVALPVSVFVLLLLADARFFLLLPLYLTVPGKQGLIVLDGGGAILGGVSDTLAVLGFLFDLRRSFRRAGRSAKLQIIRPLNG